MVRKKKHKKKLWPILVSAAVIVLLLLSIIFWRPIVYYTKIAYHKVNAISPKVNRNKANRATNLEDGIFIPKGEVYGIDFSRHQGEIDFLKLASFRFKFNQINFVYMKATESSDWKDMQFDRNWKLSKEFGFLRGAYHFFDPHVDPNQQMLFYFKTVKLKSGDLPPMLDVEQESRISTKEYRNKVKQCLLLMEKHYKMKPILYINQDFYQTYFATEEFEMYPLWISRLKKTPPSQENWVFWQFSHTGIIPGISEDVDVNVFKGSMADFKILLKK